MINFKEKKKDLNDCSEFSIDIKDGNCFISAYTSGCGCCSIDVIGEWMDFAKAKPILEKWIAIKESELASLKKQLEVLGHHD